MIWQSFWLLKKLEFDGIIEGGVTTRQKGRITKEVRNKFPQSSLF